MAQNRARSSSEATERPGERSDRAEAEAEEEEAEEENCVPATGQGCYSFETSLLQRAAQICKALCDRQV